MQETKWWYNINKKIKIISIFIEIILTICYTAYTMLVE